MMALLRKEWREHWRFFLLLYGAGAVMLGITWIQAGSAISPLWAWRTLLLWFGTAAAILLPNRLVMREYGLGTQLFLESLPVRRGTVLLTKWLAGWTALLLFLVPAFGLVLFAARHQVYLDAGITGLAGIVALRSLVYLAFVYAGAFAIALTLRFRFFLWAVLFLCVVLVDTRSQLPLAQWPPFLVAGPALVLEGARPPWREIAVTAALACGLLAVSMGLVASARGALVVVLSRRMSAGARTLLAVVFGAVMSLFTLIEKRQPPPPFRLEQAVSSPGAPVVHVGWMGDVGGVAPARLAADMSQDLGAMRAWLGLRPLAALSLVPDAWRDPHEIGIGQGSPGQLVVRAALGAPGLALPPLQELARIVEILDQSPAYRWHEDRTWLLRGFSAWWQAQHSADYAALLQRRAAFAARVLRANGLDDDAALRRADTVDELLGDCLAAGYAWHAVQALYEQLGPARFQALMRAALGQSTTDNVRGLAAVPSTASLLDTAGVPLARLAGLQGELRRRDPRAPPAALILRPARLAGDMFELRWRIAGAAPGGLAVRYKALQPADTNVQPDTTYWAGATAAGVLPATFAGGTRVFVVAEADDPALGCRYRLGAVREALP